MEEPEDLDAHEVVAKAKALLLLKDALGGAFAEQKVHANLP